MSQKYLPISRRTVLKGLGVTMCLPLLEAMEPLAAFGAAAHKQAAPVRLAVLYMPNGVHPNLWTPTGAGSDFALSEVLSPLSDLKSELLVFTDLMNHNSTDGDGHYAKVAPFLTGTHITKTTGSDLRCGGVSMDQIAAQRVGNLTPLPSLELAVEPPTTYVDTNVGYTALYGSHISWSSPTTPVTREIDPQLAFDRLFRTQTPADRKSSAGDRSILDLVSADARSLQNRVGHADRMKLQEYFDSVRSVEKRIAFDAARQKGETEGAADMRKEVELLGGRIKSYYQDPARIRERGIDHTGQVRLMLDIMVLGFWTDSTRVATFMFGNEVSGRNFAFLPGVHDSHHEISHHQNEKVKMDQYKLINQWHIQQYAYMLNKMKSIREGDGTLLDNSMALFGCGMRDGNAHSPENLPLVLAGKAGGRLATGRHLVYTPKTHLTDLYTGMLARMGAGVDYLGDSDGELPGLSDPNFKGTAVKA